jgi:acetyl-CoA carboxylase biotin carboxyl carrier protein
MSRVKPEDIETLVELFDASDWTELRVTIDGAEILLSKNASGVQQAVRAVSPIRGQRPAAIPSRAAAPVVAPSPRDMPIPDGLVAIRAPNLGTYYKAPKPGAAPFVEVGQRIHPDTEIGIIEVMKLFTTVRSGIDGTVREVVVTDGQMVEFDQPLILVEPAG